MKCQMAGNHCERLATCIVQIHGLGERRLCYHCEQALTSMGMGMRKVGELRRVSVPKPQPFWGGAA